MFAVMPVWEEPNPCSEFRPLPVYVLIGSELHEVQMEEGFHLKGAVGSQKSATLPNQQLVIPGSRPLRMM